MRHLLPIATLVAASTLAARAGAATNPPHAPPASCFLVGSLSTCADITSRLSAIGFEVHDPSIETILTAPEAAGSFPFEVPEGGVFVSAIRSVNGKDLDTRGSAKETSLKTCREQANSHAGGVLCSVPLAAEIVAREPPGMLLMALGLLGIAALDLWRRSRRA